MTFVSIVLGLGKAEMSKGHAFSSENVEGPRKGWNVLLCLTQHPSEAGEKKEADASRARAEHQKYRYRPSSHDD
jgi:hypothetical protein